MPWSLHRLVAGGRRRVAPPSRAQLALEPPVIEAATVDDSAERLAVIDAALGTLSNRVGALETSIETMPLLVDATANMNSASRRLAERGDRLEARFGDVEDQLRRLRGRLQELDREIADVWLRMDELHSNLQLESTPREAGAGGIAPSRASEPR